MAHSYIRRRLFVSIAGICAVSVLFWTFPAVRIKGYTALGLSLGPSYRQLYGEMERLPQHDLALPFPEGKNGRYVKFSVQANFLGWNNCLNERLMNTHLAYVSDRAYVFADYWWAPEHYPFPPAPRSGTRTPMNALIAGPVVGGSWHPEKTLPIDPLHTNPPRAISERWWETVCPPSSRRLINTEDIKPHILGGLDHAPGQLIFDTWHKILLSANESCVEITYTSLNNDTFPQIFDLPLWGGQRILDLWDAFSRSPVSTLLRPSQIVVSAVQNNIELGVFHAKPNLGRLPMPKADDDDPFRRMRTDVTKADP
ncbi:hypothetical protein MIND_01139700 [Mycena indigotica]|uniref:Uncharacterized protein n=1 Tax=Mycena indigotica TaxID=2126181 RepID=A0A8H6S966_9AGAR|nr:uncharacterized protein MIND_01139700 [Mycena indigotica]KAF7293605.1 hypothetical protein MIND_01139700 [Mycena indigotica]